MKDEFIVMINVHRGILYKISNLYCDDEEDRKDLFQEMVLQLWKSYPGYRAESSKSTWMYRIALNTSITRLRKEKKEISRRSLIDADFEIPDFSTGSDQHGELALLRHAIDQLNEIEKAVIMLYLEEKSYEEIADIMGITKSNVGVKLNRIKIKLEKIIKKTLPC
ncbi:RNA polymerase sigma factor [Arcticibacter sp.]|jgi:RNA polymerase sigma-70 factor (ECF subfamily)|uniref:RNA polymerase sigma factor n=1 Tax=Arcticibacter sp. TaxID=1872630 RepID=UPI003890181C